MTNLKVSSTEDNLFRLMTQLRRCQLGFEQLNGNHSTSIQRNEIKTFGGFDKRDVEKAEWTRVCQQQEHKGEEWETKRKAV